MKANVNQDKGKVPLVKKHRLSVWMKKKNSKNMDFKRGSAK